MENDKIEQNTASQLIINNIDVGNTILACFCIKDAADLLETEEPQLRDILLKLIKATLDKIQMSPENFNTLKQHMRDSKTEQLSSNATALSAQQ